MGDYNKIRRRELKHIDESIKADQGYKGVVSRLYNKFQKEIEKDITSDLDSFAYKEGLSMVEARKVAVRTDIEGFQDTAKDFVERKDLSPRANRELRKYNVTLRTNRLELLEARINLATIGLASEEDAALQKHIEKSLINEYTRQAGILEMSVPSEKQIQRMMKTIMATEREGISYSDYVWQNQSELRDELNKAVRRSVIRGENPRKTARELKGLVSDTFDNKKYAAERIAITETARAQDLTQKKAFKDAGIDKFVWIAEPDACDECAEFDDKVYDLNDSSAPSVPVHPNCKCSTAAYVE